MAYLYNQLGSSSTNLNDIVLERIIASILDGSFKRGQVLTAAEVADWLGVSKTPVREAFMILNERGLLEKNSSRSYVVSRGNKTDVLEVAQVRVALESLAIELSIQNIKPEDFDILESIVMQMEGAAQRGDNPRLVDLDLQFHVALWRIGGNTRLEQLLEIIKIQVNYFLIMTRVEDEFDYPSNHRIIIDTIKSGDVERAKEIIKEHIMMSTMRTIARLERV